MPRLGDGWAFDGLEGPVVGFEFEGFVHLAGPLGTFFDPGF